MTNFMNFQNKGRIRIYLRSYGHKRRFLMSYISFIKRTIGDNERLSEMTDENPEQTLEMES